METIEFVCEQQQYELQRMYCYPAAVSLLARNAASLLLRSDATSLCVKRMALCGVPQRKGVRVKDTIDPLSLPYIPLAILR